MPRDRVRERITSLDVARRAGVSQSAVSRTFTPDSSVSAKTAEKVRQAAAELSYRPNILARSLITGKSHIIGVLVSYLDNFFYPDALEKLSNTLQSHGYHVLIFMAAQSKNSAGEVRQSDNSDDAAAIDKIVGEILDYQVDGIILASISLSSTLAAQCQAAGVPVILFNRSQSGDYISSVTSDNFAGGIKVGEYLAQTGHKRPAYIAGLATASTQRDREAGFMPLYWRGEGHYDYDAAARAARIMAALDPLPDAVFIANDHMTFAVMDVLRYECGLSVPDDISVIGYDDVLVSSWPAYNLTTVRQPADEMVAETVSLLLKQIDEGQSDVVRKAIDGPLILRGSCRTQQA
jgi:DNA-binding LacI/PurR family transcriptional regulator